MNDNKDLCEKKLLSRRKHPFLRHISAENPNLPEDELCLYCGKPDRDGPPAPGCEFVCGSCVCLLMSAELDALIQAHKTAGSKGNHRHARALSIFMARGGGSSQAAGRVGAGAGGGK